LSDDGQQEVWSVQTTARPVTVAPGTAAPTRLPTWFKAGSRSGSAITVTSEGPDHKTIKDTWDLTDLPVTARDAYLSVVEVFLLDRLLPHQTPAELGFYAYYPNVGKLSMRSARIVPAAGTGAGYDVFSRPALDQREDQARYDAKGKLIERIMGENQVAKPTTAAELETLWKPK
jgi:hypothetical protein